MNKTIKLTDGMFYYLISKIRPNLARRIADTNCIETIVMGLGRQGIKHAGLMKEYGTSIVAGIAPNQGENHILEKIPVYNSVKDCLNEHPNIAAASIWRHFSTAKDAAVEVIETGIPVVVLITEGIPLKDARDIICAARKNKTLLIGGNTPGLIFPPERIKIGMLPDIFCAEEPETGKVGPNGVTIISRSGAILYHMSDALASVGIAQNAVIGIGGDSAVGSVFIDLVPMVMEYSNTDLVVIAGEIGGCQEELLAEHIKKNPELYFKPIVAVLSGAHAPPGKTMGHAGAIINQGAETGTFESKKKALESVDIPVINSQYDLVRAVQKKLNRKTYFKPERYYEKMNKIWEAPRPRPVWNTTITDVQPNKILVRGYRIQELIEYASFIETVYLIVEGTLPDKKIIKELEALAVEAAKKQLPEVLIGSNEDLSKTLGKYILTDRVLEDFNPHSKYAKIEKTIFCLGRTAAYISKIFNHDSAISLLNIKEPFSKNIFRLFTGQKNIDPTKARILEAMIIASIDHGVTPPSSQAGIIAASVRAQYEVAISNGIGAVTDVHGGAGQEAVIFFRNCIAQTQKKNIPQKEASREIMYNYIKNGRRIQGMGHRIHTKDPRCDILWKIADSSRISGPCVAISKISEDILKSVRGINLPINVDGIIGAIIADMNLDPGLAKAIFIYGRIAGLSAHYFEEITTQPKMRMINFEEAVYRGADEKSFPVSSKI